MKNKIKFIPLVILFCFIFNCQQSKEDDKTDALRTLRESDKAWSQSAPDLDAFMSFISDDVVWFTPDSTQLSGKKKVHSYMEKIFILPSFSLTFNSNGLDVSDAGDMGYVYGLYKWSYMDSSGNPVEFKNHPYTTIWKKQSNGEWKVVLEADY